MGLTVHQQRQVVCIVFVAIDKFEVKTLRQHRGDHSQHVLRKCLAKANTLATVEWKPAELRALRPFGSLRVWVRLIETVRVESFRLLPVHRTALELAMIDQDRVVCLDMQATNRDILFKVNG